MLYLSSLLSLLLKCLQKIHKTTYALYKYKRYFLHKEDVIYLLSRYVEHGKNLGAQRAMLPPLI